MFTNSLSFVLADDRNFILGFNFFNLRDPAPLSE